MTIRNESYWSEIEGKPPFDAGENTKAWHALERLQQEGSMRAIDILMLGTLLSEVYDCGVAAGKEERDVAPTA